MVFLSCDDEELCRRYKESRHRHPLAVDRPLLDGIATERQIMAPLRARADLTIDTTGLSPGALKRRLAGTFASSVKPRLVILVASFSYALGLPRDADLVFDVRFLNNPHYRPELAAADRARRPGRRLLGRGTCLRAVLFVADNASRTVAAALRCGRQDVLDHRARLHRRAASFGFRRRTSGRVARHRAGNTCLIEHRGLDRLPM